MISSKFSRAIAPLAVATGLAGAAHFCTINKNTEQDKSLEPKVESAETPKQTNPLQNPATTGTLFALGLLGTAGAAAMGKAVDVRYKQGPEKIEDIYDRATVTAEDYEQAFQEACQELDAKGETYDKGELKRLYQPKSKDEILTDTKADKRHLLRVTENCAQDKNAHRQVDYLVEEIASAVKYDKKVDPSIKTKIAYQYDKATTPKRKWAKKDAKYKAENPNINFDQTNGVKMESFAQHATKVAVYNNTKDIVKSEDMPNEMIKGLLVQIKEQLQETPEILNKYDRAECLKLVDKALSLANTGAKVPNELYEQIQDIYVIRQQTY